MHADASSSRTDPWDVAVIGAGPAGATAALHLADRGRGVLLLDRHPFPRDKACGDGLIPDALHCLERAGLLGRVRAAGFEMREIAAFSPSRDEMRVPTEFIALKRLRLDALIVEEAVRRGAELRRDRVTALSVDEAGDAVTVETRDGGSPIRARYALVATGADVSLLRGLGAVRDRVPSAVAIRRYIRSGVRLDHPVLSFDRAIVPGYAWIFPIAENEYNVGCGLWYERDGSLPAEPRAILDRFLETFPLAREIVEYGDEPGPVRGARLRCGLGGADPVSAGRVLAVGETMATTFPFSGEGIGKAMETAEIAADVVERALAAGDARVLDDYADRVEALRPRYRGYVAAQRWLSHPRVSDFVIRRARTSAFLQTAFEGILTETVDPREVFSVRGLARALFR